MLKNHQWDLYKWSWSSDTYYSDSFSTRLCQYQKPLVPSTCASCHLRVHSSNHRDFSAVYLQLKFVQMFFERNHVDFCQAVVSTQHVANKSDFSDWRVSSKQKIQAPGNHTQSWRGLVTGIPWNVVEFLRMSFRNSIFFGAIEHVSFREGYIGNTYIYLFLELCHVSICDATFSHGIFATFSRPLAMKNPPAKNHRQDLRCSSKLNLLYHAIRVEATWVCKAFRLYQVMKMTLENKIQNMLKLICFKMA